jgi:polyisoprenyl-phosphate glycosyltransferase
VPTTEAERVAVTAEAGQYTYSVVVPVYNSEGVVGHTIDRILGFFATAGLRHELVLVNDGSTDGSWDVIANRAATDPHVVALDLLRNYGQHRANLAGFREATGDFVITMDDDLQNPPEQILPLIGKALEGHDVVFGRFERKRASWHRRCGSSLITWVNRRVFDQPPDLAVSNFRILRREVVDRICRSRTAHPYIPGQALLYSSSPADVLVRHEPRTVGTSGYTLPRILRLVMTILFSYSLWPLRVAALTGFAVAVLSFLIGSFYLVRAWFVESPVEGWTTLVVLVSFLGGCIIALLSMVGEYLVRILDAMNSQDAYHVARRVTAG